MTATDLIASSYRTAGKLLHRFVDDLTVAELERQPFPGSNTASWIIGHLALTMRRTAERLGATDLPNVPPELAAKLATTGKPADAPTELGNPTDLLKIFDDSLALVIARVGQLTPEALSAPAPFPVPFAATFGEGLLFGSTHVGMHVGQITMIRRSLGKPPMV